MRQSELLGLRWQEAGPEILAFTGFPKEHWRQLWSNNSLERLNKEIRRRTDEWAVSTRGYMSAESIAKALAPPGERSEEVIAIEAAASNSGEDGALSFRHHLTGRGRSLAPTISPSSLLSLLISRFEGLI